MNSTTEVVKKYSIWLIFLIQSRYKLLGYVVGIGVVERLSHSVLILTSPRNPIGKGNLYYKVITNLLRYVVGIGVVERLSHSVLTLT